MDVHSHINSAAIPGIPMLKCVYSTLVPVVHLKVYSSSMLESPVQKYFSGLSPTKLTRYALSYLKKNTLTYVELTFTVLKPAIQFV